MTGTNIVTATIFTNGLQHRFFVVLIQLQHIFVQHHNNSKIVTHNIIKIIEIYVIPNPSGYSIYGLVIIVL